MSVLTPPARQIDPRGQRFGAGVSAIVLAIAFALDLPWLAVLVGLNLGVSAAFGTRLFLPGRLWPSIRTAFRLGPPREPEHEYPPRFAQTLGSIVLIASLLAFALGATTLGWVLALGVAGLQAVLGITGYCLGCRMYFLRWWIPDVVTSIWTRGARHQVIQAQPIRYG